MIVLCCLLWALPGRQAAMSEYEDTVLAFIPRHGAEIVTRVASDGADGSPHEVQVFRFPSQAALDAFMQDPDRAALADQRDRAVARTELFPVTER